jgi:S-adenosylmethionine decarboxylase proenzyme
MTLAATPAVLPNPVFEGSEKRVEIDFDWTHDSPSDGLRALTRQQLDELMSLAACTIVSSRTNSELDAYVLSESSLFVYPTKWVLKTCGTTKLLNAVPRLLEMAATIGMKPRRCKYSRASFLFPEQQVRGSHVGLIFQGKHSAVLRLALPLRPCRAF